jgi:hypothetical protein
MIGVSWVRFMPLFVFQIWFDIYEGQIMVTDENIASFDDYLAQGNELKDAVNCTIQGAKRVMNNNDAPRVNTKINDLAICFSNGTTRASWFNRDI